MCEEYNIKYKFIKHVGLSRIKERLMFLKHVGGKLHSFANPFSHFAHLKRSSLVVHLPDKRVPADLGRDLGIVWANILNVPV